MSRGSAQTGFRKQRPRSWHETRGFSSCHFDDPDEAAEATPGATNLQFSPIRRGGSQWLLRQAILDESRLVTGQWPTALVASGCIEPDTVAFVFGVSGSTHFAVNGHVLGSDSVAAMPAGMEFAIAADHKARWVAFQMSNELFDRARQAHGWEPRIQPGAASTFRPGPARQERLHRTLGVAMQFAQEHSLRLEDPRVSRGLQRMVLRQLLRCLDDSPRDSGLPDAALVGRITGYLRDQPDKMVDALDLCAAVGIGDRALRRVFADVFGTSPARFLRLRRLHQARTRLGRGGSRTVTDVAIGLGFFDVGRFASDYRALFGELPSGTLRRRAREAA